MRRPFVIMRRPFVIMRRPFVYNASSVRYNASSVRYISASVRYISASVRYISASVRYISASVRYISASVRYISASDVVLQGSLYRKWKYDDGFLHLKHLMRELQFRAICPDFKQIKHFALFLNIAFLEFISVITLHLELGWSRRQYEQLIPIVLLPE